jgi:hypothetical protein
MFNGAAFPTHPSSAKAAKTCDRIRSWTEPVVAGSKAEGTAQKYS